jgi:hypothetical protein
MKEIIEMMKKYAERHNIEIPSLDLECDESGMLTSNPYFNSKSYIKYFEFDSIDELKQKLSE